MSPLEFKARLNTKIRQDIINRINNLEPEVKQTLKAANIDTDVIIEKASAEPKGGKVKQAEVPKIQLRSLDSIVGVEKIILNKYKNEIDQNIWGDQARFRAWAEERLKKVLDFEQNPDYTATGQFAHFNEARKQGVENWYKFLKEESNYKDDVFVHLLVMDGITSEMKPNNAATPPAVSHESFEATYNALIQNNTKVSFSDIYAQQTKLKAIQQFSKGMQTVDGIEGQWVTIPRSKKGEPDYDEHIAMVQALAEGSSWCLRFENAHNYLQGGNLHFFVDKNGNSQVAINETDGTITQIQKRYNQDSSVPVPYANVIETWAKENNYRGLESSRQTAVAAKPEFDKQKAKFSKLQEEGRYLEIFKELGINVTTAPDGTYILSGYNPMRFGRYTLFDLGINENKLLENVSEIHSNLNLDGSSVNALPKLRVIKGSLKFGDNKVSDLRSLEELQGKKIFWEKKAPTQPEEKKNFNVTEAIANAASREDFVKIRDEIKNMPASEEKTALIEQYQTKYREWSSNPERPDIRMQYQPESQPQSKNEVLPELKSEDANTIRRWFEIDTAFDATNNTKNLVEKIIRLMSDKDGNISPELLALVEKVKNSGFYGDNCDIASLESLLSACKDPKTGRVTEENLLNALSELGAFDNVIMSEFNRSSVYITSNAINTLKDANGKISPKVYKFITAFATNNPMLEYNTAYAIEKLFTACKNQNGSIDLTTLSEILTDRCRDVFGKENITVDEIDGMKIPKVGIYELNAFNEHVIPAIKYAKDSNGNLSPEVYQKIKQYSAKEGFSLPKLINKLTNYDNRAEIPNFDKYLDLGMKFDNQDAAIEFLYQLKNAQNINIDAILENPLPTIKMTEMLAKDGNIYQLHNYLDCFPLSELQYEVFEKLTAKYPGESYRMPEIMKLVNENNIEIFNLLNEKHNGEDLVLKNGSILKAENNRLSLYQIKDFLKDAQNKDAISTVIDLINSENYIKNNYINSSDLSSFISVANRNSEFTKFCMEKGIPFNSISKLEEFIKGEIRINQDEPPKPLTDEQKNFVFQLMSTKTQNGNAILDEYHLDKDLFELINKMDPKYYDPILKIVSQYDYTPRINDIYGGFKKIENSSEACKEILTWCVENDVTFKIDKYMDDCKQITEAEKDEILTYLKTKPAIFENYKLPFSTIINNIDKIKFFDAHPELTKQLSEGIEIYLTENCISTSILERSAKVLDKLTPEIKAKISGLTDSVFGIACAAEFGVIPLYKLNIILDACNALSKYDSDVAKRIFKIMKQPEHIVASSITSLRDNVIYAAEALKEGRYDNTDVLKSIIYSNGTDLSQNQLSLKSLIEEKARIIKDIRLKCQNTSPKFADKVTQFMESEEFNELLASSGLTREEFTENLFSTSKLLNYIDKKPQDFVNGQLTENQIKLLKQMLQYETRGAFAKKKQVLADAGIDTSAPDYNAEKTTEDFNVARQAVTNIEKHIDNKFPQIISAIAATDIETVKLLLDKRLLAFSEAVERINYLDYKDKELLSDMIRNGKRIDRKGNVEKLTGQQKLDLIELVACVREVNNINGETFDYSKYKTPVKGKNYILDIDALRKDVFTMILQKVGFSTAEISRLNPENINWDMSKISLLARKPARDNGELAELVREASRGNFAEYIKNTSNPHGAANAETASMFAQHGLNYKNWQNGPEAQTFKVGSKDYTVKLWNRIPQESLFDGSYTTCCTSIDGTNGGSMANYMLNTAINVVEVRDARGNVVATSRCYIGEVDGKNTFIIENIEANNGLIKEMSAYEGNLQLTEGIFNYIKDFASSVGGPDMPILMSTSYNKIGMEPFNNLTTENHGTTLVGKISKDQLYLNTYHGYVDANNLNNAEAEFYVVR